MANKTQKTLHRGIFTKFSTNKLYLNGTVNSVTYKDVSTGLVNNKKNLKFLIANKQSKLEELVGLVQRNEIPTLVEYGYEVLQRGTKATDNKGRVGKKGRNKKNQKDVMGKFEKHIKPFFKNTILSSVTTGSINNWQKDKLLSHSPSTVTKLKYILNRIFWEAIGDELITRNPVEYSEVFENYSEKGKFYTPDEVSKVIQESRGFFRIYLYLMLNGLRPSEINGLMPFDFDTEEGILSLNRSLNEGGQVSTNENDPMLDLLIGKFGKENVNQYRESTKNHKRTIVFSKQISFEIAEYINDLPATQEFLFVTKKLKTPYSGTKNIIKYHLKPLLKMVGVDHKGLYAFRHIMATMYRSEGSIGLSERMGHSKATTTDIYDHGLITQSFLARERAEAQAIEDVLFDAAKLVLPKKMVISEKMMSLMTPEMMEQLLLLQNKSMKGE